MMAAASDTASPVKRLITPQGVLTLLGGVTGIAAILLPFAIACPIKAPVPCYELRILDAFTGSIGGLVQAFGRFLWAPLLLPVPICAAYLRWLLKGRLASWVWRTGYALAVLAGVTLLAGSGVYVLSDYSGALDLELPGTLCGFVALSIGTWGVMRNRRVGVSHALNAFIALQVVYVAGALTLLVPMLTAIALDRLLAGEAVVPVWGALFILLTVVVYVVQMLLGSRQKGANRTPGTSN